jgi:hypothetical protein
MYCTIFDRWNSINNDIDYDKYVKWKKNKKNNEIKKNIVVKMRRIRTSMWKCEKYFNRVLFINNWKNKSFLIQLVS